MPIVNMSDSRNLTDYTRPVERAQIYKEKYNVQSSMELRNAMQNKPDVIRDTPLCNKSGAVGQSVLCGGPVSQYVSKKSNASDFPNGPIKGPYGATQW